jgi:anti-sigma B factor antagonist
MSTTGAKLFVLVGEQFACIKIIGRANFSSSIDFKTVMNELLRKGYHFFVIELSECLLMDSTFLGVLAGFGLKTDQGSEPGITIQLLNPNARIMGLLENLGVLHLFTVKQGELPVADDADMRPHNPVTATRQELTRACLEAHQTLMQINPGNVSKFKEVTRFLAEDLSKPEGDKK